MDKKYELTHDFRFIPRKVLRRVRYLKDIPSQNIKAGDKGGYIESEKNLSQNGDCCVLKDAMVFGDAIVFGNATVSVNAIVKGSAIITGNAVILGDATVHGDAHISGHALLTDKSSVRDNAEVSGYAKLFDTVVVEGHAKIEGNIQLYNSIHVGGNAKVLANGQVYGDVVISGEAIIYGFSTLKGKVSISDTVQIQDSVHIEGHIVLKGKTIIKHEAVLHNTDDDNLIEINGTSKVQDRVSIKGSASISDSHITDDAKIKNSTLVSVEIFDSPNIDSSRLEFINVDKNASVSYSQIYGESTHAGRITDNAVVTHVTAKKFKNLLIADLATLHNVSFEDVDGCFIVDNARLNGTYGEIAVLGIQIRIGDFSRVETVLNGGELIIAGKDIVLEGYAEIIGGFIINDKVRMSDYASLKNARKVSPCKSNLSMNADECLHLS